MIWDKGSKTVFFELEVNSDTEINESNAVALAFARGDTPTPKLLIYFQPLQGCHDGSGASPACAAGKDLDTSSGSVSLQYASYSSNVWSSLASSNSDPNGFEVVKPWIKVSEISGTHTWTLSFKLKVPVDAAGEIENNVRVYSVATMVVGGNLVAFPLLCNPNAGQCDWGMDADTVQASVPINAMKTSWPMLKSSNSPSCGGVKVIRELVGSDYGVTSGFVPGTSVPYQLPGTQIPRSSGAKLRAGFYNGTGNEIPSEAIEAEFYIADWGAQYTSFDDSATWTRLFPGKTFKLRGSVLKEKYAGQADQGKIESDVWIPPADMLNKPAHQCMFVRLKSTKSGIDFTVDSVYRNMDLVTASVARRPATIDLGNRPLPKGKDKHEVYLLVRTQHMPDPATCAAAKGKLYGCAKGGRLIRERRALTKAQRQALKADFAAGRTNLDQAQVDALLEQKDRKGAKTEDLPFVVVYAMVDTGRRVDLPGKPKTPVLQQFSEFGYYVEHEGDLEGWETLMHGAEPVPGTNNLFKLEIEPKKAASVANTMRVLSKETKACKTRPNPRLGVVSQQQAEEIESKLLADVGKGDVATMDKARMTDEQLGCDPPPLRMQCRLKDCGDHSPAAFIDGSRYVGDWKGLERRRLRPHQQPDATQPDAKPAKPKAGG